MTDLETKLEAVLPALATKADLTDLRADMREATASTETWMVATVVGMMVCFGGLFVALSNSLERASNPALAAPPIVINVRATAPAPPAGATLAPAPEKTR